MSIIQKDTIEKRPVVDIIWMPYHYSETYKKAHLTIEATYKPLAKLSEPFKWINETKIAPWTIYVLKRM